MTEAMAKAKYAEWLHICVLLHDVKQYAIEYGELSKAVRMGHECCAGVAKAAETAMNSATEQLLDYINQVIEEN
jgi:hypothetical protein